MTISSAVNKIAYTANGTSKDFTVPFYFIYKSDLKVYRMNENVQELLTLDTDYTVTGAPELSDGSIYKNGGTVVMTAMPAAGTQFIILREVPLTQEADYQEGSTFPAALHELALDKLTMAVQQLKEKSDRAVTVDMFSEADPSELVNEIEALYGVKDEVITAAGNIDSIVTAAENIDAIVDAPDQAMAAAQSATVAEQAENNTLSYKNEASSAAQQAVASSESASNYAQSASESAQLAISALSLQVGDIGIAISVDETTWLRRKLNGQVIDINANTQAFYNYLIGLQTTNPSLFATESEWQAEKTSSKLGQCGKFVIDTEAQTIRLPAIANINGLLASGLAGNLINESLPNITGSTGISVPNNTSVAGAFKAGVSKTVASLGTQTTALVLDFDASEWSSTYQNDAPVQQEAVLYPFFIQINTGSETTSDITNEQELNNPFSFGDSKYTTIELNNLSWLRSQGQWNPKTTYPDYYDWVLTNANSNVDLFKLSTETYDDYDWVVNTDNETFRLPVKTKQAPIQSGDISVFGNGMSLGITNGTYNYGTQTGSGGYLGFFQAKSSLYGATNGTTGGTPDGSGQIAVGITTDPTKSGIKAIVEEQTGLHLYFYVGETVQNANLIDAGRIADAVANVIPNNSEVIAGYAMPSDQYIDLTLEASGTTYTAPADGDICFEQNVPGGATYYIQLIANGFTQTSYNANNASMRLDLSRRMKKGTKFLIVYSGGTNILFRFIYAEGSK